MKMMKLIGVCIAAFAVLITGRERWVGDLLVHRNDQWDRGGRTVIAVHRHSPNTCERVFAWTVG